MLKVGLMRQCGVYLVLLVLMLLVCIGQEGPARADSIRLKKGDVVFDDPTFSLFGREVRLDQTFGDNPGAEIISGLYHFRGKWPFEVRSATGIRNGFAVISGGVRYIVYDPIWYQDTGSEAGAVALVLGHEVGHHVCGHTMGMLRDDPHSKELEADRYLGAAVRKFEASMDGTPAYTIEDVLRAARQKLSAAATPTHPGLTDRIAAILDGYRNGSPCDAMNLVKSEPFTQEDREKEAAERRRQCDIQAAEWCAFGTDMKRVMYESFKIAGCISSLSSAAYYSEGRTFYVFKGIDCTSGGRVSAGAFTHVPVR